jgi:hypothetical protein
MKLARLLVCSLIVLASAAAFAQSSPQIVAQVSLQNQSADIPRTVLVTPTASGIYRITAYFVSGSNSATGGWGLRLHWKDEDGGRITPIRWADLGRLTHVISVTYTVRSITGQPIQFSVNGFDSPNFSYNLFITVEQLESDQ